MATPMTAPFPSCPDLIRASTPFLTAPEDVDRRVKPGDDESREVATQPINTEHWHA